MLLDENMVADVQAAFPELCAGDMAGLLARGEIALQNLRTFSTSALFHLDEIKLLAPIQNPPKIICAWVNYPNPAVAKMPPVPIFFSKYASAIIGPYDAIVLPLIGDDIVVEPELAAVIGTGGRHISAERALDHVAGYTIVNDVTAFSHRLQNLLGSQGPYMMAKSFDSFAPMGPAIVTRDEVGDPHMLTTKQYTNGELQTECSTSEMVYKLPELISYVSDFFTLEPGDILLAGSPFPLSGKPQFLQNGDHVRIEISGIGVLENGVVPEGD